MRAIREHEWITNRCRKWRLPAAEPLALEIRALLEDPIARRNGALYAEHRLAKYGVEGERWMLSWMMVSLSDSIGSIKVRRVRHDADPSTIPNNAKLPAIRRYYRLPDLINEGKEITRQMTTVEKYEAIWQACSFLDAAGVVKRGRKLVDFRIHILLPDNPKKWEILDLWEDRPVVRKRRRVDVSEAWDPIVNPPPSTDKSWQRQYVGKGVPIVRERLPSGKIVRLWNM